jgi:hypothetical protein
MGCAQYCRSTRRRRSRCPLAAAPECWVFTDECRGQEAPGAGVSDLDLVQVTADRFAEPVQEVPNSIEVIGAEELRCPGRGFERLEFELQLGKFAAGPWA